MKSRVAATLLMIVTIFFASHAVANMYKWVDKNGVTHFSDVPPSSGQKVKTIKTRNYPGPNPVKPQVDTPPTSKKALQEEFTNESEEKKKHTNKVVIYTTSWCGYCKKAIKLLRSNNIKFKQYDIEKDPKANAKMRALGGTGGVPFAIINGIKVRGFSKETYKKLLGLR